MKNLSEYKVKELSSQQLKNTSGGFGLIIAIIGGVQLLRNIAYEFGEAVAQAQQE